MIWKFWNILSDESLYDNKKKLKSGGEKYDIKL
jgi:hypothetical protein